ncbi:chemokine (C-X-C motif) ligand 18b [Hoplias malabaricus]|uniref:chemokine (C-X-C motif) ligand 18b n=1 Tax=Hoplias malabaricus TaxID=27720 RepID=UPI0034628AEA
MAFAQRTFCLVLAAVFCIQLSYAQAVPGRCECLKPLTKPYPWRKIEEFSIRAPDSLCKEVEIILTLKPVNPDSEKTERRCLSPILRQAKLLEQCWESKNKDGRKTVKISECQLGK